ncbi:MAG: hypothetical protein IJZ72_06795 [Oscillospiraceae bacterium]|nr:hypothetical protein [Oscillospiraceae bacterium]
MKPEYCKNVIVGVVYKKKFSWYITHKDLWRMDYRKEYDMWKKFYAENGRTEKRFVYEVGSFQQFCERRWGIEVLDEKSAECFLEHVFKKQISADKLREIYSVSDGNDLSLNPVFYVDFDKRIFCSNFPEPENFNDYIPAGWGCKYCGIDSLITKNQAYWSVG